MNGVHTSPNPNKVVTAATPLEIRNSQTFHKKTLIHKFFNLKENRS